MAAEEVAAPAPTVARNGHGRRAPGLLRFVLMRIGSGAVVVWVAVTLIFFVVRVMPGSNNLEILLGGNARQFSSAQIAAARAGLNLDKPLPLQYLEYVSGLLHGDLGQSYVQSAPVVQLIAGPLVATVQLTVLALAVALVLALAVTVATSGRAAYVETSGRLVEIVVASLPQFWLALMLLIVFAISLHWFPVAAGGSAIGTVLPTFALAIPLAGLIGQLSRQSFEEALEQPFVLSARARGLSDTQVRLRHVLRHALSPVLALSGQATGWLIGGALVIEGIFARPGLGTTVFQAVQNRDVQLILGVVIVVAAGYVCVNIIVDVLQRLIDPRIEGRG